MTNCPNCNAILSYDGGLHCDYCGAMFERPHKDFTVKVQPFDVDETVFRDLASSIAMTINEKRGRLYTASTHETR